MVERHAKQFMDEQKLLRSVNEAASAVVSPQTGPTIRAEASKYLEDLSHSRTTWPVFAQWTRAEQPIENRLLNLQLLQTKVRKQIPYEPTSHTHHCALDEIRSTLEGIAVAAESASNTSKAASSPACICLAAILIRTNGLSQLVELLIAARSPVSHLILANIPLELQSVPELTNTAVATELQTCCHTLLAYVQEVASVDILLNWVDIARITISQIAHFPGLFEGLLTLLRSNEPTKAAQILQDAIAVPSDSCTATRMTASQRILASVPTWNFDLQDRGKLLATFTTEEIDTLIMLPSEQLLSTLLRLHHSPDVSVRGAILECWLAVSDKPVSERHNNWGKQLFQQITRTLLETVCLDDDDDDRAEYQRLCGDVLIDCYCLLRFDFLELVVSSATSSQSVVSSLVCLNATAREINSRVKSKFAKDGDQVAAYIGRMIPLLGLNVESAQFVGRFAPTWAVKCQKQDLLQMLASLMRLVSSPEEDVCLEASKSIKQLLINSSSSLKDDENVLKHLQTLIRAALTTHNEEALANVTEGCIRTGYDSVEIVKPIVQMAEIWLRATTDPFALNHLSVCLNAFIVALRFSELSSAKCYTFLAPFLKKVSSAYLTIDSILDKLLGIERQLLVQAPVEALTHFQATISFVLDAFAVRHQAVCLNFFATAVESAPAPFHDAFRESVSRFTASFIEMLQKHGATERAATIEAFYEMIQRCLLFCPAALVASGQLPAIIACAIDCLEASKGERQSTRAILNFLSKTYAWKFLPVKEALQHCPLDLELSKHGAKASALCIGILMGGTQALLSPCADCIFSIVAGSDPRMAHTWLAIPCSTYDQKVVEFVIRHLLALAVVGSTANKSKANMLLRDFAMIQSGELSPDTLVSYTLQ